MVRRWVVQSHKRSTCQQANDTAPTAPDLRKPGFVPVQIAPALPAQGSDIRIELQHERTNIHIHWPMAASSQCAQWLREVLA